MKKVIGVLMIVVIFIILVLLFKNIVLKEKTNKTNTDSKATTTRKVITNNKKEDIMDGITLNYHASIRIEKKEGVIYFDPYKIESEKNDANYIFITHSHYDHYSESDIKKIMKDDTKFVVTSDLENKIKALGAKDVTVVYPEETYSVGSLKFDTIPSYNTNKTYHKKSYNWVGYNVTIDGNKYYIVGDSDVTDELKKVKCDVIFIPVGGTYTMTDEEAKDVVNSMDVKYAVPIHYGEAGSKANAEAFVSKLNSNIKGVILK